MNIFLRTLIIFIIFVPKFILANEVFYLNKKFSSPYVLEKVENIGSDKFPNLKWFISNKSFLNPNPYHVEDLKIINNIPKWTISNRPYLKNSRKITSVANSKISFPNKSYFYPYEISTQLGSLQIAGSNSSMNANFSKFKFDYKVKPNETTYSAGLSIAKFSNIKHSLSQETITPSGIYSEFTFSVSRPFKKIVTGFKYDSFLYFLPDSADNETFSLAPKRINRFSATTFYPINYLFGIFSQAGLIQRFGPESVNGYDISLGLTLTLGKSKNYKTAFGVNQAQIKSEALELEETSKVVFLNLTYGFD